MFDFLKCDPNRSCAQPVCREDRHHLWYEKKDYKGKQLRQLRASAVLTMCRDLHAQEHARRVIPQRPDASDARTLIAASSLLKKGVAERIRRTL